VNELKQLLNDAKQEAIQPTWKAWQPQKPRNTRYGRPPKD
jgi:hypothetical protein